MDIFAKAMQDFGDSMDKLTKESLGNKNENSYKDKKNLEKIWGKKEKSSSEVKIWSDETKNQRKTQRKKDKTDMERIWGNRK